MTECAFCGQEVESPSTKHTIADCAYHLKAEVERLRNLYANEAAKNFQYEAEKAEPGRLLAEVEELRGALKTETEMRWHAVRARNKAESEVERLAALKTAMEEVAATLDIENSGLKADLAAMTEQRDEVRELLDALDSYNGHLAWMDKHYPLDVPYFAESEDVGCQVMRLSRKVMQVEAEVERLKCCGNCGAVHTYNAGTEDEFRECPYLREDHIDHDYMDTGCAYDPSRWEEHHD